VFLIRRIMGGRFALKLTALQKFLWILAGITTLAFVWWLLWADFSTDQTQSGTSAFRAAFELIDHQGIVRTEQDFAGRWMLVFVSIDPERDTPSALAEYVPLFDAGIIGLTGTPEQIMATSETFPIYYERIEEASAPDGHAMGHTSHLFLCDTNADFAVSWPYGTSAEEIFADLSERI